MGRVFCDMDFKSQRAGLSLHNLLSGRSDTEQGLIENVKSIKGEEGKNVQTVCCLCVLTAFQVIYTKWKKKKKKRVDFMSLLGENY